MTKRVGIIGSGLIGRGWAMVFAAYGYKVALYDDVPARVADAMEEIEKTMIKLSGQGLLRGQQGPEEQFKLIEPVTSLKETVCGVNHIQECVPEDLDLKIKLFEEIDRTMESSDSGTTIASSTSSLGMSRISSKLHHRQQTVVAHPVNPLYYVPLVEVVPAPYTREDITQNVMKLMKDIEQEPVLLKKEVVGFANNRLQFALAAECWNLVKEGVISAEDLDKVLPNGLGTRYAFIGAFEVCHLNADGFLDYCKRYGGMIEAINSSSAPPSVWQGETAESIQKEMCDLVSLDQIPSRREWRDDRLAALAKLKRDLDAKQPN